MQSSVSPLRLVQAGILPGDRKSPIPFGISPGLYPASPQANFFDSLPGAQHPLLNSDFTTLMQPPKFSTLAKSTQTDMNGQALGELVSGFSVSKYFRSKFIEILNLRNSAVLHF